MNLRGVKSSAQKVVIITGCGGGIGLELSHQLYKNSDMRLVLTARQHHLEALRQVFQESDRLKVCELDVCNESNIYSLVQQVSQSWGRIDVLINNAAVCYRGVVEHMDSDSETHQLMTNYLGPMMLTRAVLPIMREQREGQIINISSTAGVLAMPTMASYSASKHALTGASEALWYEAIPFGIKVHLVELGFVNSSSFENVVLSEKARLSSLLNGPHAEYYKSMEPMISFFMRMTPSSPQKIAARIHKVINVRPHKLRVAATFDVWLFAMARRLLPSKMFHWLALKAIPGSVEWGGHWKSVPKKQLNAKITGLKNLLKS